MWGGCVSDSCDHVSCQRSTSSHRSAAGQACTADLVPQPSVSIPRGGCTSAAVRGCLLRCCWPRKYPSLYLLCGCYGWVRPSVCPADSHIATCCMPSTTQQEPTVARKRLTFLFASELTDRCWRVPFGVTGGRQGRQAGGHAQEVGAAALCPLVRRTHAVACSPRRQRHRCGVVRPQA